MAAFSDSGRATLHTLLLVLITLSFHQILLRVNLVILAVSSGEQDCKTQRGRRKVNTDNEAVFVSANVEHNKADLLKIASLLAVLRL